MKNVALFAAVGTPLAADETLDSEALEAHVVDQFRGGMTGVLIGGTMGLMQLLTDDTYRQLVRVGASAATGHGEVMVGVGDTSFARTRDRIRFVNQQRGIDGVVCLSPFLVKFSQDELVDYFTAIADESRWPVYLYDLPVLTGVKLSFETVLAAAKHPNIRGIKCSTELGWSRQLADLSPKDFRVIFAQADLVDVLLRASVTQHLDGVFALAPDWTAGIARASASGNWERAAALQQKLSALLRLLKEFGVFPSFTRLLNARGIPGNYCPAPLRRLDEAQSEQLLARPIVADLLAAHRAVAAHDNGNGAGPAAADTASLRPAAAVTTAAAR